MTYVLRSILPEDLITKNGTLYEFYTDLNITSSQKQKRSACEDLIIFNMISSLSKELNYLMRRVETYEKRMAMDTEYGDDICIMDMTSIMDEYELYKKQLFDWTKFNEVYIDSIIDNHHLNIKRYRYFNSDIFVNARKYIQNHCPMHKIDVYSDDEFYVSHSEQESDIEDIGILQFESDSESENENGNKNENENECT